MAMNNSDLTYSRYIKNNNKAKGNTVFSLLNLHFILVRINIFINQTTKGVKVRSLYIIVLIHSLQYVSKLAEKTGVSES